MEHSSILPPSERMARVRAKARDRKSRIDHLICIYKFRADTASRVKLTRCARLYNPTNASWVFTALQLIVRERDLTFNLQVLRGQTDHSNPNIT